MLKKVDKENVITELEKTGRRYFGKYNKAFAIGTIIKEFEEVKSNDGKILFYNSQISVKRQSGKNDIVNITVPNMLKKYNEYVGKNVQITGQFRSYIRNNRKRLFLFANTFEIYNEQIPKDANLVYLEGYLTEKSYTKIAKNVERKLSSFCIAVRRKDSKRKEDADYINCLAWTDNADLIESIEPKEKVKMYGRMQSRKVNGYEVYFITVRNFL